MLNNERGIDAVQWLPCHTWNTENKEINLRVTGNCVSGVSLNVLCH